MPLRSLKRLVKDLKVQAAVRKVSAPVVAADEPPSDIAHAQGLEPALRDDGQRLRDAGLTQVARRASLGHADAGSCRPLPIPGL